MGRWWNVGRTGIIETSCGDYVVEVRKFETPSGSHPTITVQYHHEPITLRWRRRKGRRRSIIPSRPILVRLLDSAHVPFIITQNCALDLLSEALTRIFKDHALHVVRARSLRRRSRPTSLTTLQLPSVVLTISCSSKDEGMEDYMEEDDPELEEEEEPKEEEDPEEEVDPKEEDPEEEDPEEEEI